MKELRMQPNRNGLRTEGLKKTVEVEDDVLELARLASISFLLSGHWFCL